MIIGYARVSTDGQSLDAQKAALKGAGAERVFAEKESGANINIAALTQALRSLGPGDCLIVTRLDRLARSTRDLLNTLAIVAQAGASFRSLADTWADTTTARNTRYQAMLLLTLAGLPRAGSHQLAAGALIQ